MTENNLSKMNAGKLFWGLLLVVIGGLALAGNFGLVSVNFANLWRLWPILIIMSGLSILSLQGLVWRLVILALSLLSIFAIVWALIGDVPDARQLHTYTNNIEKTSARIKELNVSIKSGAGSLKLYSINQPEAAKIKLESNISTISLKNNSNNLTQYLTLGQEINEKGYDWVRGDARNIWNIGLNRDLVTSLAIDSGASSGDINLIDARLRKLNIKTGISELVVKIGDRESLLEINIESGVSSLIFKLPKESGINLTSENGLSSNNLSDLKKVSENIYESANYMGSKNKINIVSKVGLSSFTIERY